MYDAHRPSHPTSSSLIHPQRNPTLHRQPTTTTTTDSSQHNHSENSVTTLLFLPSHPTLLLSGSASSASLSLWDIRTTHHSRRSSRGGPTPLSVVPSPPSHLRSRRRYGLTSLCLSTKGDKIYSLSRDNTVYVYATSHLILGSAPELSANQSSRTAAGRRHFGNGTSRQGLGPLYGLRHPMLYASSFYVKMSLRPSHSNNHSGDDSEILAVGSNTGTPILFPTDPTLLSQQNWPSSSPSSSSSSSSRSSHNNDNRPRKQNPPSRPRPSPHRQISSNNEEEEDIPIYDSGTALTNGHESEVTDLCWSKSGRLVSVGDDQIARLWREDDRERARELRVEGEGEGRRWRCGWAEVTEGWDEEDG